MPARAWPGRSGPPGRDPGADRSPRGERRRGGGRGEAEALSGIGRGHAQRLQGRGRQPPGGHRAAANAQVARGTGRRNRPCAVAPARAVAAGGSDAARCDGPGLRAPAGGRLRRGRPGRQAVADVVEERRRRVSERLRTRRDPIMASVQPPQRKLLDKDFQDPGFYDQYSPNHELPYSSLASFAFHFCLMLLLPLLASIITPEDTLPPEVSVVTVANSPDDSTSGEGDVETPGELEATDESSE